MANHAVQSGTHSQADRGFDLYSTPPDAVRALLKAEPLPSGIWECAAGRGAIVNVLRDAGHPVIASDIVDHGFPLHFVGDFLEQTGMPAGCECIVTNPPFKIVDRFIAHALDLCPRVIVLARLALLESVRRTEILERRGLARIHVFRNRLPMMHRDGWTGPRASSATAYAWFCWDRNHSGPTTVDRLSHDSQKVKHITSDREQRRRAGAQQQHPKQLTLGFYETTEAGAAERSS